MKTKKSSPVIKLPNDNERRFFLSGLFFGILSFITCLSLKREGRIIGFLTGGLNQILNDKEDRGVNVRNYIYLEVEGDFTPVIQAAMNSGSSIIEFPNWNKTLRTPVVVPSTVKEIRFNKVILKYDKVQILNTYTESMFIVDGVDNLKVSGGKVEYLGTFDLGSSYAGKISAFHITNSQRFQIEGFEATKFNNCGINISPNKTDKYCVDPIIRNCYLHHNRVAGLGFGNTENLLAEKNRLEYNGIELSTETGYGVAGWRDAYPKNSKIIFNQANYNYRKGIDFHSGYNGIIKDNFCKGNYQYGIFVFFENKTSDNYIMPVGEWTIENNTITEMSIQSTLYKSLYGIIIGSYSSIPSGLSFIISKNKIRGFTQGNGQGYVIQVDSTGLANAIIILSENIIDVGDVSHLVRFQENTNLKGTNVDVSILDNSFKADSLTDIPFSVRSNSLIRNLNIDKNNIEISSSFIQDSLCNYADSNADVLFPNTSRFNFINNNCYINKTEWGTYDLVLVYRKENINLCNNFWNGKKYRDWDGKRYIVPDKTYPLSGYWTVGSVVRNTDTKLLGISGNQYVVDSWKRITNGTGNALNKDWVEVRRYSGT